MKLLAGFKSELHCCLGLDWHQDFLDQNRRSSLQNKSSVVCHAKKKARNKAAAYRSCLNKSSPLVTASCFSCEAPLLGQKCSTRPLTQLCLRVRVCLFKRLASNLTEKPTKLFSCLSRPSDWFLVRLVTSRPYTHTYPISCTTHTFPISCTTHKLCHS